MKIKYMVIFDFSFEVNNTKIFGQLQLPYVNGKLYKTTNVVIYKGELCDSHEKLNGTSAKANRDFKNELIAKYTKKTSLIGVSRIENQFNIKGNYGIVKIASMLSGFNTNKSTNMIIFIGGKKMKAGETINNLKTYRGSVDDLMYISAQELSAIDPKFKEGLIEGNWNEKY